MMQMRWPPPNRSPACRMCRRLLQMLTWQHFMMARRLLPRFRSRQRRRFRLRRRLPPLLRTRSSRMRRVPPCPGEPSKSSAEQEAAALRAALDAVEAERTCAICLDAPRCTALLPCRHMVLCGSPECAAALGAQPRCPTCRQPVADIMQLFV